MYDSCMSGWIGQGLQLAPLAFVLVTKATFAFAAPLVKFRAPRINIVIYKTIVFNLSSIIRYGVSASIRRFHVPCQLPTRAGL
jgi:hypothetical protein